MQKTQQLQERYWQRLAGAGTSSQEQLKLKITRKNKRSSVSRLIYITVILAPRLIQAEYLRQYRFTRMLNCSKL